MLHCLQDRDNKDDQEISTDKAPYLQQSNVQIVIKEEKIPTIQAVISIKDLLFLCHLVLLNTRSLLNINSSFWNS
jgi:hypothetical protein